MTIIDIAIALIVLVFIAATIYNIYLTRLDHFYKDLYIKENEYTKRLEKQLFQREEQLKDLQNDIKKNSTEHKNI